MENIIIKYLENRVTDEEKQQLLNWLNESSENQKRFNDYSDIWLLAADEPNSQLEMIAALNSFKKNFKGEEQVLRKISIRHTLYRIAASVAVILLTTGIGFTLGKYISNNENTEQIVVNQYVIGDESKGSVKLPDGTEVWLNANSRIKYPEIFDSRERIVELEGEAFFDVAKNENHPFKVVTNDFKITVLGTTFDIRSRCFEEKSEAVLLTGRIVVENSKGQEFTLRPNQKITYDKLSKGYSISEVLAENYVLWKNDQLEFENEKLSVILEKLKYWYGTDIHYDSDIAKDIRLSLRVRKESKDEIFRLLDLIAPIESRIDGYTGNVRIKKK